MIKLPVHFSDLRKFWGVGEPVDFVVRWDSGSHISDLEFDMKDPEGQSAYFRPDWGNRTARKSHSYSSEGHYHVSVKAWNRVGTVEVSPRIYFDFFIFFFLY